MISGHRGHCFIIAELCAVLFFYHASRLSLYHIFSSQLISALVSYESLCYRSLVSDVVCWVYIVIYVCSSCSASLPVILSWINSMCGSVYNFAYSILQILSSYCWLWLALNIAVSVHIVYGGQLLFQACLTTHFSVDRWEGTVNLLFSWVILADVTVAFAKYWAFHCIMLLWIYTIQTLEKIVLLLTTQPQDHGCDIQQVNNYFSLCSEMSRLNIWHIYICNSQTFCKLWLEILCPKALQRSVSVKKTTCMLSCKCSSDGDTYDEEFAHIYRLRLKS